LVTTVHCYTHLSLPSWSAIICGGHIYIFILYSNVQSRYLKYIIHDQRHILYSNVQS
jgi:hypothetical protein